jgi:4-amino-4-deoxy-L-arabinose transferase-like glycosyltransferase
VPRRRVLLEALLVVLLAGGGIAARAEIMATGWVYVGGDSYGYVKLADEWRAHGRLAFGPAPLPEQWYRRPLYPLFVRFAKRDAPAMVNGGLGWKRIQRWQLAIELILLWPLLYAAVRRRAGPAAALIALALAAFFPPAALYPLAALTEAMAMALALLAVAPLLERAADDALWPWCLAGAGLGLSALLRPDGVLWAIAVVPILMLGTASRRMKLRGLLAYSVVFAVLFLPWPIRNLIEFGHAHLTDGMVDRFGTDIPEYRGYWNWMRTWSRDERAAAYPSSCFYDPICVTKVDLFEGLGALTAPATNADLERVHVAGILERRQRLGLSKAVSDEFEQLAEARLRAHPFRVLVWLPLRRAMRAWWAPPDELAQNSEMWPRFARATVPHFKGCARALYIVTLISIFVLLLTPAYRMTGLILATPLVFRSLILGWTAFSLPRYISPGYPLCFALIGIGIVISAGRVRALFVKPA